MKRILIAGSGSYIGTHLLRLLQCAPERYSANELDVRVPWPEDAFRGFDAVVLVAGLAHQKETEENRADYRRVNCDLAIKIAEAAKLAGVRQLIFLSSMSVYGCNEGRITKDTLPAPTTAYGQSKWDAEQQLALLVDASFQVAVLRPPMVYGRGCPGNYGRLASLAVKLPVFPAYENERSMIYVETLCAYIRHLVDRQCGGLHFPQNADYVKTTDMMKQIAAEHGHRLRLLKGFGWSVSLLRKALPMAQKVFGTLTYDKAMSDFSWDKDALSFHETIRRSEGKA